MQRAIATLLAVSLLGTPTFAAAAAETTAAAPQVDVRDEPTTSSGLQGAVGRHAARRASMPIVERAAAASNRSWAGRHPVLLGTLVGLGGGLTFVAVTAAAGTGCSHSSDYTCGEFSLWFGGLGAGIGAGVGGVVSLL